MFRFEKCLNLKNYEIKKVLIFEKCVALKIVQIKKCLYLKILKFGSSRFEIYSKYDDLKNVLIMKKIKI
jgi:hypothetical protein